MWPAVVRDIGVRGAAVTGGCELPNVGVLGTGPGPFRRATSVLYSSAISQVQTSFNDILKWEKSSLQTPKELGPGSSRGFREAGSEPGFSDN